MDIRSEALARPFAGAAWHTLLASVYRLACRSFTLVSIPGGTRRRQRVSLLLDEVPSARGAA
jgi:hypothetical protein